MKKYLLILALAGISQSALADNNVGCGLGTQVFKGQSGLAPKVLAATTNGSFGNQTFGITFGTLGCSKDGVVTAQLRTVNFIALNSENLARDMSVGHGEALEALANVIGIRAEDKQTFFKMSKSNFGAIYAPENQTAGQVMEGLNTAMNKDAKLSRYTM